MIDPISLEVFRNRIAAVASEMGDVLRRTAHSPNIKERADCSVAIFDPAGEMVAQAEHIPVHLGSMPASVSAVIERFNPVPGLQYAVNDPFAGGTHLNDLTLVRPVFVRSALIGWVANRAHHADVGGEAPGSMPTFATRLVQEGHVVSPMAAVRDGSWLEEFHPHSRVELDYAGVGRLLQQRCDTDPATDTSARDVARAVQALAAGDVATATQCYAEVVERWRLVRLAEHAN